MSNAIDSMAPSIFAKSRDSGPPPPSDGELHRLAAELGRALPPSYVELLRSQRNGGRLRRSAVYCPAEGPRLRRITEIFGSRELALEQQTRREWAGPFEHAVYFGAAQGHEAYLLDYSDCSAASAEPRVLHVTTNGAPRVEQAAASFDDFLSRLISAKPAYDWVSAPGVTDAEISLRLTQAGFSRASHRLRTGSTFRRRGWRWPVQLWDNRHVDGCGHHYFEYPDSACVVSLVASEAGRDDGVAEEVSELLSDVARMIHRPHPAVVAEFARSA